MASETGRSRFRRGRRYRRPEEGKITCDKYATNKQTKSIIQQIKTKYALDTSIVNEKQPTQLSFDALHFMADHHARC